MKYVEQMLTIRANKTVLQCFKDVGWATGRSSGHILKSYVASNNAERFTFEELSLTQSIYGETG